MSGGFGLPVLNIAGMLGGIGKAYDDAYDTAQRKTALAKLGEQLQGGNYGAAAQVAFQAGDPGTGIGLLKLGEQARTRSMEDAASRSFMNGLNALNGGGDMGVPRRTSDAGSSLPSFADTSGPSGDYTANLFRRESNSNDFAQAPTSSARGAGQFTRGTWNRVAAANPDLNLTPVGNGQDGRTDRAQMVRATNALTAENEGLLRSSGLPISDATRYSLHLLGGSGGRRFVAGAMSNPDAPAASYASPQQVAANTSIFYNRDGSPKSAGQVLNDFGRSFGGGGGTVQQARAPSPSSVAYADDEAQTQALEQRMGMVPPSTGQRQVASADPRADMPVPGAQEAAFYIPGTDPGTGVPAGISGAGRMVPGGIPPQGASSIPTRDVAPAGRTMTMPGDPSVSAPVPQDATIGNRPVSSIQAAPSGQKIPFLMQALASPHLPAGQKELASMLLKRALDETAVPDSVKEFMWARAHGMTQAASPNAYALEKQRNPGADLTSQIQARQQAAAGFGMDPNSPEFRSYALTGKEPNDRDEGAKITSQIEARRAQAPSLGLEEGTPAYRSFVGTGKLGADRDMSASDKKAIQDADNQVLSAQSTIDLLGQAKELSKKAYAGPTAGTRAMVTGAFGSEAGQATQDLDNLLKTQALGQLKSIFGAAPTEGERAILLEINGSSDKPQAVRDRIYDRATRLAEIRLRQNQDKADELRGGTYFRPGGGGDAARQPAARQAPASQAPQQNGRPAGASSAADRFGQLVGSGMTKAQAYDQLHREGF